MEFTPYIILTVILKWIIDYAKMLLPDGAIEDKVTPLVSLVAGVGLAALFSADDIGEGIQIWSDVTLATASWQLVLAYGLALAAGAGVISNAISGRNRDS